MSAFSVRPNIFTKMVASSARERGLAGLKFPSESPCTMPALAQRLMDSAAQLDSASARAGAVSPSAANADRESMERIIAAERISARGFLAFIFFFLLAMVFFPRKVKREPYRVPA